MRRCALYRVMVWALLPLLAAAGPAWSQDVEPAAAPQEVQAAENTDTGTDTQDAEAPPDAPPESPPQPPQRSVEDIIGLTAARQRLGRDIPIGRGVVAGHVEGVGQQYVPNWKLPGFKGTLFVQRSGQAQPFDHATSTASTAYGQNGLAPGIRVVHCFSTAHWLTDGYLNTNSDQPPTDDLPQLFSHSWIAEPPQGAELVLRRIDYQIDERDVLMCVGVNNGRGSHVPAMLASSYNAIAVGAGTGASSGGYTRVDTAGRCKPDIVAPHELTSIATPIVTACVARLMEAAATLDAAHRDRARRSELIKAVLLAGAEKPDGWAPAPGKPLDEHLGAGMVHLDHSLRILQAGPSDPGELRRRYGWDFRAVKPDSRTTYRFKTTQPMGETSILLTWNRRISPVTIRHQPSDRALWLGMPRMADFDLRLVRIIDDGGALEVIGHSASDVDNVEHLHVPALEPGEYVIEVQRQADRRDEPWDYALAWRVETAGGE